MTEELNKNRQETGGNNDAEQPDNGEQSDVSTDTEKIEDELEKYKAEAREFKAKADEYLQLAQRVQADFDNFRRRTIQEREESAKYCSMRLALSILPVLDNFERAFHAKGEDIKQFMEGMELIYRQLRDVLEKEGVKPMDAVGDEFDPNLHEAVMQEASDKFPNNTVMEEFQKGYFLADRVLRPAMVKVAKS